MECLIVCKQRHQQTRVHRRQNVLQTNPTPHHATLRSLGRVLRVHGVEHGPHRLLHAHQTVLLRHLLHDVLHVLGDACRGQRALPVAVQQDEEVLSVMEEERANALRLRHEEVEVRRGEEEKALEVLRVMWCGQANEADAVTQRLNHSAREGT